jgi:hypothetical protein
MSIDGELWGRFEDNGLPTHILSRNSEQLAAGLSVAAVRRHFQNSVYTGGGEGTLATFPVPDGLQQGSKIKVVAVLRATPTAASTYAYWRLDNVPLSPLASANFAAGGNKHIRVEAEITLHQGNWLGALNISAGTAHSLLPLSIPAVTGATISLVAGPATGGEIRLIEAELMVEAT